jgi:hypothetical protein
LLTDRVVSPNGFPGRAYTFRNADDAPTRIAAGKAIAAQSS